MTLDHVLALQRGGGQILDTRDPGEFAAAHLAGSINIGLGGQYATWAGTMLEPRSPDRRSSPTPDASTKSAIRLGRIGFDHIVGYLKDGLRSLESRPDLTATTERVSAPLAAERLAAGEPLAIDVRAPGERDAEARRRQRQHPAESPRRARRQELPKDRPLLVYCAGGYRSSIAASLLQQRGFTDVSEIAGGIAAWEAAKLPVANSAQQRELCATLALSARTSVLPF